MSTLKIGRPISVARPRGWASTASGDLLRALRAVRGCPLPAAHRPPAVARLRGWQPRPRSRLRRDPRADAGGRSRSGLPAAIHVRYQETFGSAPISFRSPAWCPLSPNAIAALVKLGYRVDSSVTPQRLPIFSSTPYANTWFSHTAPHTNWRPVCWKYQPPACCCRPPRPPG